MSRGSIMIGVAVVALASGCSLALVRRAPPAAPPGPQVACTERRVLPAADAVVGGAMVVAALGLSRTDIDPDTRNVVAPIYGVAGLGLLYSAYVGFRETGRCQALHDSPAATIAARPAPAEAPPTLPGSVRDPDAAPTVLAQPAPTAAPAPPPPAVPVVAPAPAAEPSGDGVLIGTGATLGLLSAVALVDRADAGDDKSASLFVLGGALGGGALGYLLADGLEVHRTAGYATVAGMSLGLTNAALLLRPLGRTDTSEDVLPVLLAGGVLGAGGGLAVGHGLRLTRGQVLLVGELGLLGAGTVGLTSGALDRDDSADSSELLAVQIGLDVGVAAGLLLAPHVDWSYRRARWVGAATMAGFFVGSLVAVGATTRHQAPDPSVVSASTLAGMWAGFGLGVVLTRGWAPDPARRPPPTTMTLAPQLDRDRLGVGVAGTF